MSTDVTIAILGVGIPLIGVGIAILTFMFRWQRAIQKDLRDGLAGVRTEMREGQAEIRAELRDGLATASRERAAIRVDLRGLAERVARMEGALRMIAAGFRIPAILKSSAMREQRPE